MMGLKAFACFCCFTRRLKGRWTIIVVKVHTIFQHMWWCFTTQSIHSILIVSTTHFEWLEYFDSNFMNVNMRFLGCQTKKGKKFVDRARVCHETVTRMAPCRRIQRSNGHFCCFMDDILLELYFFHYGKSRIRCVGRVSPCMRIRSPPTLTLLVTQRSSGRRIWKSTTAIFSMKWWVCTKLQRSSKVLYWYT